MAPKEKRIGAAAVLTSSSSFCHGIVAPSPAAPSASSSSESPSARPSPFSPPPPPLRRTSRPLALASARCRPLSRAMTAWQRSLKRCLYRRDARSSLLDCTPEGGCLNVALEWEWVGRAPRLGPSPGPGWSVWWLYAAWPWPWPGRLRPADGLSNTEDWPYPSSSMLAPACDCDWRGEVIEWRGGTACHGPCPPVGLETGSLNCACEKGQGEAPWASIVGGVEGSLGLTRPQRICVGDVLDVLMVRRGKGRKGTVVGVGMRGQLH